MILKVVLGFLVLASLLAIGCAAPNPFPAPSATPSPYNQVVVRTVAGDNFQASSNATIAFAGIVYPDISAGGLQYWLDLNLTQERVVSCYYAGVAFERDLLVNKTVFLAPSNSLAAVDSRGYLVQYVSVDGKDAGTLLIEAGFAVALNDDRAYEQKEFYNRLVVEVRNSSSGCLWLNSS